MYSSQLVLDFDDIFLKESVLLFCKGILKLTNKKVH